MMYPSPGGRDFIEIQALNAEFLRLVRDDSVSRELLAGLPESIAGKLADMDDQGIRRLSEAPFLLFSLREADDDYWDGLFAESANQSLFAAGLPASPGLIRLSAAALAFVSHTARQNPYTLRLICCASLNWSERIGEQLLMSLISRVAMNDEVIELRAADVPAIWHRLLVGSTEPRADIRAALLNSVLQTLLVAPPAAPRRTFRSAACRTLAPALSMTAED